MSLLVSTVLDDDAAEPFYRSLIIMNFLHVAMTVSALAWNPRCMLHCNAMIIVQCVGAIDAIVGNQCKIANFGSVRSFLSQALGSAPTHSRSVSRSARTSSICFNTGKTLRVTFD